MTSKKPYFPNNWAKYAKAPAELFQAISWEEFHDWRLCQWELPENVECIIRCKHRETHKVEEFVYQNMRAQGDTQGRRVCLPKHESSRQAY